MIPWLGRSPEKGKPSHSSILAWRIPWTEEPGGPQSMGSQSWTRLSNADWKSAHRTVERGARPPFRSSGQTPAPALGLWGIRNGLPAPSSGKCRLRGESAVHSGAGAQPHTGRRAGSLHLSSLLPELFVPSVDVWGLLVAVSARQAPSYSPWVDRQHLGCPSRGPLRGTWGLLEQPPLRGPQRPTAPAVPAHHPQNKPPREGMAEPTRPVPGREMGGRHHAPFRARPLVWEPEPGGLGLPQDPADELARGGRHKTLAQGSPPDLAHSCHTVGLGHAY